MKAGKTVSGICLAGVLSACVSVNVDTRRDAAFSIARKAGFQPFSPRSALFGFQGFFRMGADGTAPVVYIEGDGFAWVDRYTISRNPTPRNPLALKLAAGDTSPSVFYLARPCQYVDLNDEPNCGNAYWTNARFSGDVIDAFDRVLSRIRKKTKSEGFHLVGFSGGGAVATLLASKRTDIKSIRTVAGNLDHVSLNAHRNVSPLTGSLNPMNIARDIRHIPQIHYSGGKDRVVPPWVAANFVRAAGKTGCVWTRLVPGAGHASGWERAWSILHKRIPECRDRPG